MALTASSVGVDGGGVGTAWVVEGVDAVFRSIFYGVEVVNVDTVIDSRRSNANGELTLYRRHPQLVDGVDGESVSLELLVHPQHDGACCVIQGQRQQFVLVTPCTLISGCSAHWDIAFFQDSPPNGKFSSGAYRNLVLYRV